METKQTGLIVALIVTACFAAGMVYFFDIDSKRHDLSQVRSLLTGFENAIARKRVQLASVNEKYGELKAQFDRYSSVSAARAKLKAEIANLEGRRADTLKKFSDHVLKVRANAVGGAWTDIRLANGQLFEQVTILQVNEESVNIKHSQGAAKLAVSSMPHEMRDRFRYGMIPFVGPAAIAPLSGAKANQQSAAAPLPSPTSQAAASSASIAQTQMDIDALDKSVRDLRALSSQWRSRAQELRSQAATAKGNGRPTYSFLRDSAEAERTATAIDAQIRDHEEKTTSLRKRLMK